MKISKGIKAVIVFWLTTTLLVTLTIKFPFVAGSIAVGIAALAMIGIWSFLVWDVFKDKT